jgi:hypothetical protein
LSVPGIGAQVTQGLIFYQTTAQPDEDIQLFSLLVCLFVTQLQAALLPFMSISVFIDDRRFFVMESASELYPTSVYYAANASVEFTLTTINAVIYGFLTYFMCFYSPTGQYAFTTAKFLRHLLMVVAGAHTMSLQSIMAAILSPSLEVACALNAAVCSICCFGGIPPRLLSSSAHIIQWVSPLKYCYTAMVINYFRGTTGEDFAAMMEIQYPQTIWLNFVIVLGFYLFYTLVGFLGLHYLYRERH